MEDNFIKQLLITKQSRVYSLISNKYFDELIQLKPTIFRIWFCEKIGVEIDIVNINSLKGALLREKKKVNLKPITKKSIEPIIYKEIEKVPVNDFKFTNVENIIPVKNRITKL